MPSDDAHRDPAIEAERACFRLILAFAYHVDHRQFDEAVALFTDDGVFERPGVMARGRAELEAVWAGRPETMVTRHLCHAPYFLSVGADAAEAVTYFTVHQALHDGDGYPDPARPFAVAEYHDRFRREAGIWKIASRRVAVAFMAKP